MGVDYNYAGSTSYVQFEKEIINIAKVFNGKLNEPFKSQFANIDTEKNIYIFGVMSNLSRGDINKIFTFPNETPDIIVNWLNHPYDFRNKKETKEIWKLIYRHKDIMNISKQIWLELESLACYGESWMIW